MLKIGGYLKAKMEDKDLQQKDLAKLIKRDQRSISNYCCDVNYPDLDTLAQMCNILDIDINDLLQINAKGNASLRIQNEKEMRLIKAYREIPEEKQTDFLNGILIVMELVKAKGND